MLQVLKGGVSNCNFILIMIRHFDWLTYLVFGGRDLRNIQECKFMMSYSTEHVSFT